MFFTREMIVERIDDDAFVDWLCEREGIFRFVVYQGMEAMEENIDSLELSVRSYNCLRRAGYDGYITAELDAMPDTPDYLYNITNAALDTIFSM